MDAYGRAAGGQGRIVRAPPMQQPQSHHLAPLQQHHHHRAPPPQLQQQMHHHHVQQQQQPGQHHLVQQQQHQYRPPPPPQQHHHQQASHMAPPPHHHQPHHPTRILTAPPMTQQPVTGGLGMNVAVRLRRGPASQPPQQMSAAMQPRPVPSAVQIQQRPPAIHHQIRQAAVPPMAATSNPGKITVLTTTSQPVAPVSSSGAIYTQNSTPASTEENLTKTDIVLPSSDPSAAKNGTSSKEKTPMCLVNELARFNKIQHQYRLTSEQGPAHRRRFTVALRLGGGDKDHVEEYTAEAPRIRAAQHAVAAEALRSTSFPVPPPRPPKPLRKQGSNGPEIIMPTVELNALAMKLGRPAVYKIERSGITYPMPPRPRMPLQSVAHNHHHHHPILGTPQTHPAMPIPVAYNRNGKYYNQSRGFAYPYKYNNGYRDQMSGENLFRVELTVGEEVFHGKGITLQAARNDAAAQALQDLKQAVKEPSEDKENADNENDDKSDDKSPVSMVHELALKFELPAAFSVKSEKGPPHMKVFTTTCTVGEMATEGEGNSKKISKKRAAENMLDKLKKLPSYKAQPKVQKPKRKAQPPKKKTRNLIKEKGDAVVVSEQNPVSRLQQWANHRSGGGGVEPTYNLKIETNGQFRRNFIIECEIAGHVTTGSGTNKKVAKRNAAESMLAELGLGKADTNPAAPEASPDKQDGKGPRKVTFSLEGAKQANSENVNPNATGRQLVPGVLLMQDHLASAGGQFKTPTKNGVNIHTTATIAKELLKAGNSPTAEALAKQENHIGVNAKPISSSVVSSTTSSNPAQISQVIRPKDQLLYLAQLLGFQVQFSDFPKGNHGEFLSLVTLSTEPPMLCHGGGLTTEESHDQSARAALENLSQMGLDNVTPHAVTSSHPSDGIRMMSSGNGSISGILTNGISK